MILTRQIWIVAVIACGLVAYGLATPAQALVINITYTANANSYSSATQMKSAVDYVVQEYEQDFSDPITLGITVDTMTGGLGASSTSLVGFLTYAQVKSALASDAKTASDASAVAHLPASDPISGSHHYLVSVAEAQALGLLGNGNPAGTFFFSTNQTYTFDPNNRAVGGAYDFIGVAEHEISEIMGRIPGLGNQYELPSSSTPDYLPFDLFRYSAPNTLAMTSGAGIYFSIDGGTTNLKNFNGVGGGSDPQDWASGSADSYNAFGTLGQKSPITAVDLVTMDVIGYDLTTAPEPSTLVLSAVGLFGLGWFGWFRRHSRPRG